MPRPIFRSIGAGSGSVRISREAGNAASRAGYARTAAGRLYVFTAFILSVPFSNVNAAHCVSSGVAAITHE
jgi:hypothetical protein